MNQAMRAFLTAACCAAGGAVGLVAGPAPAEAWPNVCGPDFDGVAPLARDVDLIDDIADLRLLWRSDSRIPDSYGTDGRSCVASLTAGANIGGGYSAPLIHGNRVLLYYHRPGGDVVLPHKVEKSLSRGGWGRRVWRAAHDAVIHCWDAETGKTIWKRVLRDHCAAFSLGFNKSGGHFLSSIDGERMHVFTAGAEMVTLDVRTGKLLWHNDIGYQTLTQRDSKSYYEEKALSPFYNRSLSDCFAAAGGVVVTGDWREDAGTMQMHGGHGLLGLDGATGRQLWYLAYKGHTTPHVWRHGGETYFVVPHPAGPLCVEGRSGRVLWTAEPKLFGTAACAPRTFGDRILVNDKARGGIACFRLTLSGPEKLWNAAGPSLRYGNATRIGNVAFVTYGRRDDGILAALDLDTGDRVAASEGYDCEFAGLAAMGDLLIGTAQGSIKLHKFEPPDKLTYLGAYEFPYAQATHAAPANGRLYVRHISRLACYDLRVPAAKAHE